MKLTASEIKKVKAQTGLDAVPEDHPAVSDFEDNFGEHTFFVNQDGLGVFILRAREDVPPDHATLVMIGVWTDETRTALTNLDDPQVTKTSVSLSGAGG